MFGLVSSGFVQEILLLYFVRWLDDDSAEKRQEIQGGTLANWIHFETGIGANGATLLVVLQMSHSQRVEK